MVLPHGIKIKVSTVYPIVTRRKRQKNKVVVSSTENGNNINLYRQRVDSDTCTQDPSFFFLLNVSEKRVSSKWTFYFGKLSLITVIEWQVFIRYTVDIYFPSFPIRLHKNRSCNTTTLLLVLFLPSYPLSIRRSSSTVPLLIYFFLWFSCIRNPVPIIVTSKSRVSSLESSF